MADRGGHQQKRYKSHPSASNEIDDKCALWTKLVELWAWGVISVWSLNFEHMCFRYKHMCEYYLYVYENIACLSQASLLQELAAAAVESGLQSPCVDQLANIGSAGNHPGNCHRDLIRIYENL